LQLTDAWKLQLVFERILTFLLDLQ